MLWRKNDSILAELNAYVGNIIAAEDKVSSFDELYMQDLNSVIHSPIGDFLYVENITNHEEERCSSQYEDEEARSDVSSDEGEVPDPLYYEEASCEDNDESCFSSQEENSASTCLSSCESDANWEEESNDGSEYSYEGNGMNS